ncbi:RNA methyltransferase [Marinicella sp. W31]|uniref:RNA methyltransferase n=1 Tax=Marinicella sp. W31 TaxID=3023713 RepID=UPI0037568A0B
MFDNIHFVLSNTTHPGNIGAVARAMKVMGLSHLDLVNPKEFPSLQASARASGADDVLSAANIHTSMQDALAQSVLVFGSSARNRGFDIPVISVHEACGIIANESAQQRVSVVFGTERFGMTNEEMLQCHYLIKVPANPEYSSLNLAAAAQVVSYEIRMALGETKVVVDEDETEAFASREKMESFYAHLFSTLHATEFLTADRAASLEQKLRVMFNRLRPQKHELDILRGILSSVAKKINN